MTSYKLIYFDSRGRGEVSRFIFAQAEVKYEDVRLKWESEEWSKMKPTLPTGQLPILEVDGRQVLGSGPIARYLAEKFSLAGSDDLENAIIAGIVDFIGDLGTKMATSYFEKDEEKKAKLMKTFIEEDIPKFFGAFESMIEKNKVNTDAGWIFGKNPTYGDFTLYVMLEYLTSIPNLLDKYPNISKLKSAVEALPNIAKWLQERPKTEF